MDHVGVGAPINGDRIYNGAMDDGSGSALILDMAATLKAHPETLKRSVLFLLVTAEEKGLLGSKYFAAHPTVPTQIDRRGHQRGHVPSHRAAEGFEDRRASKNPTWAHARLRSRSRWESNRFPIRSRCATRSSAAISTASSAKEFPRSKWMSASSLAPRSRKSSRTG